MHQPDNCNYISNNLTGTMEANITSLLTQYLSRDEPSSTTSPIADTVNPSKPMTSGNTYTYTPSPITSVTNGSKQASWTYPAGAYTSPFFTNAAGANTQDSWTYPDGVYISPFITSTAGSDMQASWAYPDNVYISPFITNAAGAGTQASGSYTEGAYTSPFVTNPAGEGKQASGPYPVGVYMSPFVTNSAGGSKQASGSYSVGAYTSPSVTTPNKQASGSYMEGTYVSPFASNLADANKQASGLYTEGTCTSPSIINSAGANKQASGVAENMSISASKGKHPIERPVYRPMAHKHYEMRRALTSNPGSSFEKFFSIPKKKYIPRLYRNPVQPVEKPIEKPIEKRQAPVLSKEDWEQLYLDAFCHRGFVKRINGRWNDKSCPGPRELFCELPKTSLSPTLLHVDREKLKTCLKQRFSRHWFAGLTKQQQEILLHIENLDKLLGNPRAVAKILNIEHLFFWANDTDINFKLMAPGRPRYYEFKVR